MKRILIYVFGYLLIWIAVFLNREGESDIKMFGGYWWITVILIFIGTQIISNEDTKKQR